MVKYSESYYGAMDPQYTSAMSSSVWRNYHLGAPTPATKALQLPEIAKLGMSGIQNVEIGVIDPMHWEAIPKQHFEEMKKLAKLQLGKQAMISVHAPIEPDAAGFSKDRWDEGNRQFAENFFKDVIDKAQKVQVDENMPVPVTIHASNQPVVQWAWNPAAEKGKGALEKEVEFIIDPESGQVVPIKREVIQYPGGARELSTEERRLMQNHTFWEEQKRNLAATEIEVDRINTRLGEVQQKLAGASGDEKSALQIEIHNLEQNRDTFQSHWRSMLENSFNKAFKALEVVKDTKPEYKQEFENLKNFQQQFERLPATQKPHALMAAREWLLRAEPPVFIPAENWAQSQAAKTFSDLAFYSYEKYGEKGPMISVENFRPDFAMGRGESLREGLKQARNLLVGRLVKEKKMSKERAEAIANDKIKATWDIGHINILKRFGAPPEIWKKELEAIRKDIGHIHISDNFGYQDVHLPPGMGNTPIKEFLKHLEKEGKLGKIKAILESGGFPAHLGIPPSHTEAMMNLGVPLYPGISVPSPTWDEVGKNYFFGASGYSSGYGKFLPEGHFTEYGTGFSQLPTALGGARAGQQDKFSGTPMA